jgi:RimJ/RimL family protein N-acetyltransferase
MPTELPLGEPLDWAAAGRPERTQVRGAHMLLRPIDAANDAEPLFAISHSPDGDPAIWTYLPDGPYESVSHLRQTIEWAQVSQDRICFTIVCEDRPLGWASYLNIEPEVGTIEIGHIWFGAGLRGTTAATEAIYLLARHAFEDLGYRRLEWKCNALNAASRRAAERFGFTFEGSFASTRSSRAAIATPPGMRSPTRSGLRSARPSKHGSRPRTSTARAARFARWPRCAHELPWRWRPARAACLWHHCR